MHNLIRWTKSNNKEIRVKIFQFVSALVDFFLDTVFPTLNFLNRLN